MTWFNGTFDTFANKLIGAPEVAASQTGTETVFALQTSVKPIFIEGVEIEFTIGTVTKQAVSDSSGDFSGHADITSGTINGSGAVTITFSTAPDNPSDILFNEYTSKGFLQNLIDGMTSDQYTETVDTGDDIKTVFANTLSNTPISQGQMLLRFKIASNIYWVWDNGVDFEHDLISTSSINYSTGAVSITFTDPVDNGFAVNILYTDGAAGEDWLILHNELSQDNQVPSSDAFIDLLLREYVITNSGSSYNDRIVIGLRESRYVPNNQYVIELNIYKKWDENEQQVGLWNFPAGFSTTYDATSEHWSGLPCFAINDDEQAYWFSSTKDRLNCVIRVSGSIYIPFSFGIGKRLGASKAEYPKPYYIAGTGTGNLSFSSVSGTHISLFKPASSASFVFITHDDNFRDASDISIIPTEALVIPGDLKKTENGKIPSFELQVVQIDLTPDVGRFEIPDVFFCPFVDLASEDTLDDGVDTYFVSQDIFRTDTQDFLSIKMN